LERNEAAHMTSGLEMIVSAVCWWWWEVASLTFFSGRTCARL